MQAKFKTTIVAFWLCTFLISTTASAQEKRKKAPKAPALEQREAANAPQKASEPSFYISPIPGPSAMFSVLLTDGKGNSVSGSFSARQLQVFEAVLESARTFALTDEAVGVGAPIITRLMEQHEWSLFVDVAKMGKKSRFYVSLISVSGKLTADGGEITRSSKDEQKAFLFEILSRVQGTAGRVNQ